MQMQYRAPANEIRACKDSFFTAADLNNGFTPKESSKSFAVFHNFQMDEKWTERRQLVKQFFFLLESNLSRPANEFPYSLGRSHIFLVVTDDCKYGFQM